MVLDVFVVEELEFGEFAAESKAAWELLGGELAFEVRDDLECGLEVLDLVKLGVVESEENGGESKLGVVAVFVPSVGVDVLRKLLGDEEHGDAGFPGGEVLSVENLNGLFDIHVEIIGQVARKVSRLGLLLGISEQVGSKVIINERIVSRFA